MNGATILCLSVTLLALIGGVRATFPNGKYFEFPLHSLCCHEIIFNNE